MLTQKLLKRLFRYDTESGQLFRRSTGREVGWLVTNGYLRLHIENKGYALHRVIWLYCKGSFPDAEIDHINHDKTDNKIENLREATRTQNCQHRQKAKNNTSGVTGVSWHKRFKKWYAKISLDGKQKHLGCFVSLEEAISARRNAELKYYGEFAP